MSERGTASGSDSDESGLAGAPAAELARGLSLGRYVVLEKLGAGGMGVVYAAYDPQLDRKVALKLLRLDRDLGGVGQRSAKLLEEAQRIAATSHPNVITVHDVGSFLGQVFVAMEFMGGGTVGEWLEQPRPWREVLAVYLKAGEGLAAAHARGLIHRDFKPDNILLDAKGGVRVTDFGLAREGHVAAVNPMHVRPGARAPGTSGFQSPEQVRRLTVTAQGDQFCFCLCLHLGLYGEHAFPKGLDLTQPLPPVRAAPPGTQVPGWVRKVLLKGLSDHPDDRYPSMRALLDALNADPARGSRALAVQVGGLVLLAAVAFSTVTVLQRESPEEKAERECLTRVDQDVESIWGTSRREHIEGAFRRASSAVGADRWTTIERLLAPQVDEWAKASRGACRVRDEAAARPQRACLEDHRQTMQSMTDLFEKADLEVMENAVNAVIQEVTPASACTLTQAPVASAREPRAGADERGRAGLARARVLWAAGNAREALEVARGIVGEAHEGGAVHVEAEALLLAGELSRTEETEKLLREAIRVADGVGNDTVRARAFIALTHYYADNNRGPDSRWADQQAISITERLGVPPLLRASQLMAESRLSGMDEAATQKNLEEALAIRTKLLPPDHPDVVRAKQSLGSKLKDDRGFALLAEVLETRKRTLGPSHADTAQAHRTLGIRLMGMGNCLAALGHFESALQVYTSPDRPRPRPLTLGRAYAILGTCQACLEQYQDAEANLNQALPLLKSGETIGQQRKDVEKLLEVMSHLGRTPAERAVVEEELRSLQE